MLQKRRAIKKARGSKKEIRIEFLLFKQTYYEGIGYILFLEEILIELSLFVLTIIYN